MSSGGQNRAVLESMMSSFEAWMTSFSTGTSTRGTVANTVQNLTTEQDTTTTGLAEFFATRPKNTFSVFADGDTEPSESVGSESGGKGPSP